MPKITVLGGVSDRDAAAPSVDAEVAPVEDVRPVQKSKRATKE